MCGNMNKLCNNISVELSGTSIAHVHDPKYLGVILN